MLQRVQVTVLLFSADLCGSLQNHQYNLSLQSSVWIDHVEAVHEQ